MRPIGFSTGALARGDLQRGVMLQRGVAKIDAIELSALRDHELPALVDAIAALDLSTFSYVSVHAPSRMQALDEAAICELLLRTPAAWPAIVHPELLRTESLWRRLGSRLCIENMDNRKTAGRTLDELQLIFDIYPEASFCLDLGHARQIDPTLSMALLMIRTFDDRLRQVHVSDVGPAGEHRPIGATAPTSFSRVARHLPIDCPVIIESMIDPESIEHELGVVIATLTTPPRVAIA